MRPLLSGAVLALSLAGVDARAIQLPVKTIDVGLYAGQLAPTPQQTDAGTGPLKGNGNPALTPSLDPPPASTADAPAKPGFFVGLPFYTITVTDTVTVYPSPPLQVAPSDAGPVTTPLGPLRSSSYFGNGPVYGPSTAPLGTGPYGTPPYPSYTEPIYPTGTGGYSVPVATGAYPTPTGTAPTIPSAPLCPCQCQTTNAALPTVLPSGIESIPIVPYPTTNVIVPPLPPLGIQPQPIGPAPTTVAVLPSIVPTDVQPAPIGNPPTTDMIAPTGVPTGTQPQPIGPAPTTNNLYPTKAPTVAQPLPIGNPTTDGIFPTAQPSTVYPEPTAYPTVPAPQPTIPIAPIPQPTVNPTVPISDPTAYPTDNPYPTFMPPSSNSTMPIISAGPTLGPMPSTGDIPLPTQTRTQRGRHSRTVEAYPTVAEVTVEALPAAVTTEAEFQLRRDALPVRTVTLQAKAIR